MKNLLILLIAVLATTTIASAQQAQRFTATKANEYGLAYTLPNTVIDITIEAEFTREEPGEFYKYALKYLNVSDPITETTLSASVKSVIITTRGIADPEKRYIITLKSNQAPYIILGEENIPLAINSEKTFQVQQPQLPVAHNADPTPLQTEAARQVITRDVAEPFIG